MAQYLGGVKNHAGIPGTISEMGPWYYGVDRRDPQLWVGYINDQHLKERQAFNEVDHPTIGRLAVMNPPWKLSTSPAEVVRHAPLLGEHNQYVFGQLLGMSEKEIDNLIDEQVIC